ncbi:hypothetical protein ABZO31_03700 [Streptomyces sp. HUAS MG47]|uniref:hypothetical protein n=1 Tax=Streptomyces solicamelliae TaxID=3231716 RepID=UPI003877BC63
MDEGEPQPGFGGILTRLLRHRRTDAGRLSSASGIPEAELRTVVRGAPPSPGQLDALAAALGLHTEDLHVMAGVPVPDAHSRWDPAGRARTVSLLKVTMALPPDQRDRVHRLVGELPREPVTGPSEPVRVSYPRRGGSGALLVNLLCGNRLGHSVPSGAMALALLTRGRVYPAASTVNGIGRGRVPLTPELVAGFAVTLGMDPGDLAAITGVELPEPSQPTDPLTQEMARLLWNCRHLTAAQARQAYDTATSLPVAVPEDAPEEDWNRVHRRYGTWWGAPRG